MHCETKARFPYAQLPAFDPWTIDSMITFNIQFGRTCIGMTLVFSLHALQV